MKITRIAISTGLLLGGLFYFGTALASQHVKNAQALTVLVTNEGLLGGGRGSGILLDSKHVLTCAHMASGPEDEMFVYTYPLGQVIKAHVEYVDVYNDILLLVLDSSVTVHNAAVFEPKVTDGEPITIVGNALGAMTWIVSKGIISGRERFYLLTDAQINHGNSGGPWLNSKGEVVAMTDWIIGPDKSMPGIGGGISAERIMQSLDSYKRSKDMFAKLQKILGGSI